MSLKRVLTALLFFVIVLFSLPIVVRPVRIASANKRTGTVMVSEIKKNVRGLQDVRFDYPFNKRSLTLTLTSNPAERPLSQQALGQIKRIVREEAERMGYVNEVVGQSSNRVDVIVDGFSLEIYKP